MARPVGNTPAPSHGTVKSERSASKKAPSGFAQAVGGTPNASIRTPTALRSRSQSMVSFEVGSAAPASEGASQVGSRRGRPISVASSGKSKRAKLIQKVLKYLLI